MTKLVVIFGFLLAFLAGWIVGVSRPQSVTTVNSVPGPTTRQNRDRQSELDMLLNLRADQKEALRKIWSETADRGRKQHDERRHDLRRQRDEKIQALLSADQKASFQQIQEQYDEQTKGLEREMRANFQKSVEATKAVLDPAQRVKYEEWLSKRQWDRGPRGGPGGPGPGGPGGPGGGGPPHQHRETTRKSDAGATSNASSQP